MKHVRQKTARGDPGPFAGLARIGRAAAWGTMLLIGAACASPPRHPAAALPAGPEPYVASQHGKVVRVNLPEGYVILECAALPNPGDTFIVYRGKERVGAVRVTGFLSGKMAAADVVEGQPRPGDWFWRN